MPGLRKEAGRQNGTADANGAHEETGHETTATGGSTDPYVGAVIGGRPGPAARWQCLSVDRDPVGADRWLRNAHRRRPERIAVGGELAEPDLPQGERRVSATARRGDGYRGGRRWDRLGDQH